jgi:hypothetical protein
MSGSCRAELYRHPPTTRARRRGVLTNPTARQRRFRRWQLPVATITIATIIVQWPTADPGPATHFQQQPSIGSVKMRLAAVAPISEQRGPWRVARLRPSARTPLSSGCYRQFFCGWPGSDSLRKCAVQGCAKAAAVVLSGRLHCVEQALERERRLPPPPRPASSY